MWPGLSGWSNYPISVTPFQSAIPLPDPIYQLKSPNCQNYPISVTWFEWVIQLPDLIYQLKSPNCQNYPISVTWFEWAIQLPDLIYQLKSPNPHNYLIRVTQFQWAMQWPNLIYQLKSPNSQNYPIHVTQFEWTNQLPNPIYQLKFPNMQIYSISAAYFDWVIQLPTQFPSCTLWVCKLPDICYLVWVGNIMPPPITPTLHLKSPYTQCQIFHPIVIIFNWWHHCPTWFTTFPSNIYVYMPISESSTLPFATKSSCIINLNIIYLLKNSLIGGGNLSKGGGGVYMRPYCQNLMVCVKSFYCIPLALLPMFSGGNIIGFPDLPR